MTDSKYDFEEVDDRQESDEQIGLAAEPLFAYLLRGAVKQIWNNDPVMHDFVEFVAQPMSDLLGFKAAKGGAFVAEMKALGKDTARYEADQSMRAHLINGLFPALHIAKAIKSWGGGGLRAFDDDTRRLFIAGFVLHDWLKFPGVETELEAAGFSHADSIGPVQLAGVEDLFREWCRKLGLDKFLAEMGGSEPLLHDLIYIACNTQMRWGTLLNLSALPRLNPRYGQKRAMCTELSRLADYLTYIARNPREVVAHQSIRTLISELSNRNARLTYHHVADNRGILTNIIHQSSLEAMQNEDRVPILYAPSGVVYLTRKEAPVAPKVEAIAEAVVLKIKQRLRQRLVQSLTGFKRDGKGLKYANYYESFFETPDLIRLGTRVTFSLIHEGKKPSAGKRYKKMEKWLDLEPNLPDDVRVDQLAEWCYLTEKLVTAEYPQFDAAGILLERLGLAHLRPDFEAVPRDNRAGGVGYHWYFAAGHYVRDIGSGLDPVAWRSQLEELADQLMAVLPEKENEPEMEVKSTKDDWQDLRTYIRQVLTIGEQSSSLDRDQFAVELHRYQNAKRRGRGTTSVCSLCSSSFEVGKQQEAAVLFAPQVYSNKLLLHGSNAIRDICAICGLEMMLRQLLMNPGKASGGNFEGQRIRYLYFYPTYFFTPETLQVVKQLYETLNKPSFTELRRQLSTEQGLDSQVHLDPVTLQRLEPLLLTLDPERNRDMRFSENEPVTVYFLGVNPPGRNAKDAESWVHPAFFALLLPLCLDVKVVASESSLPLLLEADEMNEMVLLDGAHAFVKHLLGQERIGIDQVLPALQRLIAAYLIQIDGNSGMGRGGFDYRWQDLPAMARNLETSPLYAFHYLKKWQRKQKLDNMPVSKAQLYITLVETYLNERSQNGMSHAKELTLLYRQFYRAKGSKTNSILRPLSVAAKTVLSADRRLFDTQEALRELVYGELQRRINKLQQDGLAHFPKGSNYESRETAMHKFAAYFVDEIFYGAFRGDASTLQGKQLNLLSSACEAIYRTEQAKEWASGDDTNGDEN